MSRQAADVCVIGGGIVGASAACFLAEAGASVVLVERGRLAAAASGRNSGSVQHPFDPPMARLHAATVDLYRALAVQDPEFALPPEPAGVLLLSHDEDALEQAAVGIGLRAPELNPRSLSPAETQRLEPALADGLAGCLLETGYPVAPASATLAFARRAVRAGARILEGEAATPVIVEDRVAGARLSSGAEVACDLVLIAAGPWTPGLVPGWAAEPPIRSVWGVVVGVHLEAPPRRLLEELGIDNPGETVPSLFSLITTGGTSSVGSTFLDREPDAGAIAPILVERAAEFVPVLRGARQESVRACARPASFDGRPLVGRAPGVEGLFVCAGHGPWGISAGPGSAAMVGHEMLGRPVSAGTPVPLLAELPELSPLRLGGPAA
jgi:glycine/D-amino acid oxidase-like deaminating enzyme